MRLTSKLKVIASFRPECTKLNVQSAMFAPFQWTQSVPPIMRVSLSRKSKFNEPPVGRAVWRPEIERPIWLLIIDFNWRKWAECMQIIVESLNFVGAWSAPSTAGSSEIRLTWYDLLGMTLSRNHTGGYSGVLMWYLCCVINRKKILSKLFLCTTRLRHNRS